MNRTEMMARDGAERASSTFRYSPVLLPDLVLLIDILAILLAAIVSYVFLVKYNSATLEYYIFAVVFVVFASIVMLKRGGMYEINAIMRPFLRSDVIFVSILAGFLFFLTMAFSLKVSDIYSRLWAYGFVGGSIISVIALRVLASKALQRMSRERLIGRRMAVLGTGDQARRFLERVSEVKPHFVALEGVFELHGADAADSVSGHPVLGDARDLIDHVRAERVDDVVVAAPWSADEEIAALVEELKQIGRASCRERV